MRDLHWAWPVLSRALVLSALGCCVGSEAQAQALPTRPAPLPATGRSVVSNEDSTAVVQNPANVAFLPGAELRFTGSFLNEDVSTLEQGYALGFASSTPSIPLGVGVRFDWLDPPVAAANERFGQDVRYQFLTLAFALGGPSASLGFSWQRSFSNSSLVHGLSGWTAALSSRPSNYAGFALLAKNFDEPTSDAGLTLDRSYVVALALRPLGSRAIEVGLEAEHVSSAPGYWVPRATLGVDIPYLGRARGEFSVNDPGEEVLAEPSYAFGVNLALWGNAMGGSIELGGGAGWGSAMGDAVDGVPSLHAELAFRGWREPTGAEMADYALRVRIEETPDPREHVALLRRLWEVAENEPAIRAVVVELRASPAGSLAHTEELRDAIRLLQARGKAVLCHLESGGTAALYLCSAADRLLVSRGGGLPFAGLKMRYLHLKDLLDKLHVRADFVRIGDHKSAPEQYTEAEATAPTRADRIDLLQRFEAAFSGAVARDRKLDVARFREVLATGPFSAPEALKAGLVDAIVYEDELESQVQTLTGLGLPLLDDRRARVARKYFGPQRKLAVVYVDQGELVDGRSRIYPLIGMESVGSFTLVETLEQVRNDPSVGAVVLRVESPGGSSLAADAIWRAVELTNRVKPVVVSMGGVAASGGYYVAAPTRRVFANPSTLTGSIGVYYGKADASELLKRLGITVEVYKTSPAADADAFYRPFSTDERERYRQKLEQFYELFLERVASGRKLDRKAVHEVAQGRVWTGAQAQERGLVDEVGGLRQAIAHARALGRLPAHAPVVELPERESSLLGRILGVEGVRAAELPGLPGQLRELAVALTPFTLHSASDPLMRLELVVLGD